MSVKALFPAVFFILVSVNSYAQVSGGSTGGTTPGTTGTTPGTTGTIPGTTGTTPGTTGAAPGTTGTVPGTTGTTPGTTGTIPGTTPMPPATADIPPATTPLPSPTTELPSATTELPPATTPLPPATTGIPDFREDNTNITGRLGGNTLNDGTIEDDTVVFGNRGLDTLDGSAGLSGTQTGTLPDRGEEDIFATGPEEPDVLDEDVFRDDRETPMDSSTLSD